MSPKFDAINWRIIAKLLEDGRQPYRQIAEDLGISESTVRKRIQKMIDEQIISRFTIELNPQTTTNIVAFIKITSSQRRDLEAIKNFGIQHPNVVEVYELTGQCGVLLKISVETVAELSRLEELILEISDVEGLEHCVLLRQLKHENRAIKLEI